MAVSAAEDFDSDYALTVYGLYEGLNSSQINSVTQTGDGYKYQGAGLAYGDWLSFVGTETRYVSVAYYAYDAQLMAKMARALSTRANDTYARKAESYEQLYEAIRAEFRTRYITPTVKQTSQTAYLLALRFTSASSGRESSIPPSLALV